MSLPALFAQIATRISGAVGGPYFPGIVIDQGVPVEDAGGSIVTPGTPTQRACQVQIDQATEAMRQADGFATGDVRFIILAASLDGSLNTDARVTVSAGPNAGEWLVSALERDPLSLGWSGRGRRA